MRRAGVLLGLVVAAVTAWLLLRQAPGPELGGTEAGDAAAQPTLAAAGSARTDDDVTDSAAPAVQASEDEPWVLTGQVDARHDEPLPGADVAVWWRLRGEDRRVAATRTDGDGRLRVPLPFLAGLTELERSQGELVGLATKPGHGPGGHEFYFLQCGDSVALAVGSRRALEMHFLLVPGTWVRGNVRSVLGSADHVAVSLYAVDGTTRHTWALTNFRGAYVLPVPAAGTYRVFAYHPRLGRGELQVIGGRDDMEVEDLVLDAPATIEGTVVDRRGAPLAGIDVHARPVAGTHQRVPGPHRVVGGLPGWGDLPGTYAAYSQEDGSFRIPVAGASRWTVGPQLRGPGHMRYEGAEVPPGARGVQVVIDAHRVTLDVRDAHGLPLRQFDLAGYGWRTGRPPPVDGLPADPVLHRDFDSRIVGGSDRSGKRVEFWAVPGTTWVASAGAPGGVPAAAHFAVPVDRDRTTVELVVHDLTAVATRTLTVRDASGRALAFDLDSVRTRWGLIIPVDWQRETRRLRLPRGRYWVTVIPRDRLTHPEATKAHQAYLPTSAALDVTEAGEDTLEIAAQQAGFVRLTTRVDGVAVGADLVGLSIAAQRETAPAMSLEGTDGARAGMPQLLHPGLAPGSHTLRVAHGGSIQTRVRVVVEPGEVTDVTVDLEHGD